MEMFLYFKQVSMWDLFMFHLIGDYLIQTHKMAIEKKKSSKWCHIHVSSYMIPFLFSGFGLIPLTIIYIQHWIQDRYGFVKWFMDKTGKTGFYEGLGPWAIILVDNIFHLITLWIIWRIII